MRFNCFVCRLDFHAEKFNIARVTISCPICETNLQIAQSLGRSYGKVVGEQVSKIMEALQRVLSKSKNGDMNPHILLSQRRIEQLCEAEN